MPSDRKPSPAIAEVIRVVRATAVALVGLDWRPFDREAMLWFRSHAGERFALRLAGIHLLATRQSLLGRWGYIPLADDHWEDWFVHFVDVLTDGEFLERLVGQRLGLTSHVVLRGLDGAPLEPVHVTLVTGGGHLDAVCEVVELASADSARK